ncbi:MAG: carbohydrate-binding family 9-like protein [Marinilabiliales bacterium]|nr:carbohydrate-binding family 9-like protein [Marinilabiliales bacterium]
MAEVTARLDELGEGHAVDTVNWKDPFPTSPEVRFNIAWGDNEIYIKYYVRESHVKAEKSKHQ